MAKNRKQLMSEMARVREQYNPLRSLTIARVVSLLEGAQRGQFADLQWTYEFVESTDADLLALVERRTSALCEMDWDIKRVSEDLPGYDEKLAEEQADALRLAYGRIDNIYEAVEHVEMSAFRGYSHLAPHRNQAGDINHLEPLDQWNLTRNGRYGPWHWNPEAKDVHARLLPADSLLDPSEYIVAEVRRPVDRLGLIKFVRANLSEKDWDAFVEIYGIPGVLIILPEDVPADKLAQFQAAAAAAAEGASGSLPGGSKVETTNETRGMQPFEKRLEWLSKKLVLAATGGMLTMLAESGSGTLAGGAHTETFKTIARARAAKISELFQRNIDRPVLDAEFPGKPRVAYFDIAAEEERNVGEIVEHAVKIRQALPGHMMDPDDLSERTGYKIIPSAGAPPALPDPVQNRTAVILNAARRGDTVAAARQVGQAKAERLQDAARLVLARATAADLQPLAERLQGALAADDADLRVALRDIATELETDPARYFPARPQAARALEDTISAALVNGYAQGAVERGGAA